MCLSRFYPPWPLRRVDLSDIVGFVLTPDLSYFSGPCYSARANVQIGQLAGGRHPIALRLASWTAGSLGASIHRARFHVLCYHP